MSICVPKVYTNIWHWYWTVPNVLSHPQAYCLIVMYTLISLGSVPVFLYGILYECEIVNKLLLSTITVRIVLYLVMYTES